MLLLALTLGTPSCSYLDIVPDERPTEEDAFKDKNAAERYLYSCYAFMPKEWEGAYLYQTGEVVTDYNRDSMEGTMSAANIGNFHYWSRLYSGIRRCYTMLANLDDVPNMEENLKTQYKGEAKFLIAYYHFLLLRAYGPIIIVDHEIDLDANEQLKRSPFDKCVEWIADMYDEACNSGLKDELGTKEYGRATTVAAKALKARLYLYAASPLFNGNKEFYADNLKDPETGESLMPLEYDPAKWERAKKACDEALQLAENQLGYRQFTIAAEDIPDDQYPKDALSYALRMQVVDNKNMEVIWADTRQESTYGRQNQSAPRDQQNGGNAWNGVAPTLRMVKEFYTENGLPIDEDPNYFPVSDYYKTGEYDGAGYSTCNLNLKREKRFYAWISFHNGWCELQREKGGDMYSRIRTQFRRNDEHGRQSNATDFSWTGYLVKKWLTPTYSARDGFEQYPWPIIRLGELYLDMAEACVECNDLKIAKIYLNKIRSHAGIPDVEDSWRGIAELDQTKLRQIVHQERNIELCFEGHRRWDMLRWKVAEDVLGKQPQGLNIEGTDDASFFQEKTIERAWSFTSPKNYLLPISDQEINKNQLIVQNPGY